MSPAAGAGDRARARVRDAGGDELLERLDHLDRVRQTGAVREPRLSAPRPPTEPSRVDFDVVLAGGGLWLLLAPLLAARGLRVAVLDRSRVGASHREWNASGPELDALVRAGLTSREELDRMVIARYRHGVCRFASGGTYPVVGVLDHAVSAGALLAHARELAVSRGVALLDGHELTAHAAGPAGVSMYVTSGGGRIEITARVLVDARGAASPYARTDLVCPTVGGVVAGLVEGSAPDEILPDVGEILATTEGIDQGRQHVWEAFPGSPGEVTVYLFRYARVGEEGSLSELYARFFEMLPRYKRGAARLVRPTFGYIPGWSRLTPAPSSPDARVLLVGDAAARQSPLTFCGFGATLRSLALAADAVARAVDGGLSGSGCVVDDAPSHALTGALARVMASRGFQGNALNELLDAAFQTLHAMDHDAYARLLRDEIAPREIVTFLRRTAARHPRVWGTAVRALGAVNAGRWSAAVARAMLPTWSAV